LIGIFGRKNPSNVILLFFYGLLLRIYYLKTPLAPVQAKSDGSLYKEMLSILEPAGKQFPALYSILAFILIFSQAISLNTMVNKLRLMNRPNYLPAMSYLLVTACFSQWNQLSSALIVNSLLLWIWSSLNALQQGDRPKAILFNTGFALGLCNFFFSYSFTFGLIIFAALLLYRSFRLNEYLLPILGYATPYYFMLAYRYFTDNWHWKDYLLHLNFNLPELQNTRWVLAGIFIILALALAGLYFVQKQSGKMLIQARKSWMLMLFYLLISLLTPFVNADFSYWVLCLLPIAAFVACTFMYLRGKMVKNVLHWLIVGLILFAGYTLG
jgi:Family of unknown function (DUF6427)